MMKLFCDACGKEMKDHEYERLKVKCGHISLEVISAWKHVWNGGNLCHACIREAFIKGKPERVS